MDLTPIKCMMLIPLNRVIAHVERAQQCYRNAMKDEEKATFWAKKKGLFFSAGQMNRAMKQAITATELGTQEMKEGFSKIPRHCPLRKRYPLLMSDIIGGDGDDAISSSLPDLRNNSGGDHDDIRHNVEIIRQCLQICQQQKKLLWHVKSTIKRNHEIVIEIPNGAEYNAKCEGVIDLFVEHKMEIIRILGRSNFMGKKIVERILDLEKRITEQERIKYSSGYTNTDFNKKRLIAYYTKHNPQKLDRVDTILEQYSSSKNESGGGGIQDMLHTLETKYHENVNEVWLTAFMIKYNKEQSSINDIHQLMEQYKGTEELMFLRLTMKYHDPPIVM